MSDKLHYILSFDDYTRVNVTTGGKNPDVEGDVVKVPGDNNCYKNIKGLMKKKRSRWWNGITRK